jgi:soluble lytic murein transglycosylase-like protein
MAAAMDAQKAAVAKQLGTAPQAGSFFSTAWSTAPALPAPILNPTCPAMTDDDLQPLITQSAQTQSVEPQLIRAVIRHESASYPCAISEKGALGLMQLMPDTAEQFNVDPLDPKQNVEAGTKYLKQLLTRYKGDVKLAVAAYNAGPQRVDVDNKVPNIPETMAYVDAILKDLKTSAAVKK